MTDFLLRILGFDFSRVPSGAHKEFTWTNAPQSWGVFVLIGLVALAIYGICYLYRREISTCPRAAKIALTVLRIAVLLILVMVLLGPAISVTQTRTVQPTVLVLIDDSLSMGQPERYIDEDAVKSLARFRNCSPEEIKPDEEQSSRLEIVRELLIRDDRKFVRNLSRLGHLTIHKFSSARTIQVGAGPTSRTAASSSDKSEGSRSWGVYTLSALVTLAIFGITFIFRQEIASSSRRTKMILASFYLAVLVGIGVVFFGPTEQPPVASLKKDKPNADTSQANSGDSQKDTVDLQQEITDFLQKASGKNTNMAKAIRDALDATRGSQIAAIVLISDGQHNVPDVKPLDAIKDGVPIFTVGVGDPSKHKNLKVLHVFPSNSQVIKGESFSIEASIHAQDVGPTTVDVSLFQIDQSDQGGDEKLIRKKPITFTLEGPKQIEVTFPVEASNQGDFTYRVQVELLPSEQDPKDNVKDSVTVSVLSDDQTARVLLIAGGPTWDYRLLQAMLTDESRFELSCWLQSMDVNLRQEGNHPIEKMPHLLKELAQYHVVIMLDPNPMDFDEQWIDVLTQYVDEHGGGLLYVAGHQYADRFLSGPRTRGIRKLLPVYFDISDSVDPHAEPATHPWLMRIEKADVDHAIMRFVGQRDEDFKTWNLLPGIYWSYPTQNSKPGAHVLISRGDPSHRPLLVAGRASAGRIVFMGFSGTWRWRRIHSAEYFQKFWFQMTKFLVENRNLKGKNRVLFDLDQQVYNLGDTVNIDARLLGPSFEKLTLPEVVATLRGGRGNLPPQEVVLKMVDGKPGAYKGAIHDIARMGNNRLSLSLQGKSGFEQIVVPFTVELPKTEMKDLTLNKSLLKELATNSEGQYFEIDSTNLIPGKIPRLRKTTPVTGKPVPLWDTAVVLGLLVIVLSVEWILRKKHKLV